MKGRPPILPAGWTEEPYGDGWQFRRADELMVISSVWAGDSPFERWLHVSCSRPDQLPTWEELREVKDLFVGKNRKAIQVLPPESEYVNCHPYVLHLYCCLDRDPLPDFRIGGLI